MNAPPVKIAVSGMAIVALVFMILGIAHVARRQEVVRRGYELSRAVEELARKQEENRRLRLEKSTLTNPERIRTLAESLGMTQPVPEQIRIIRNGRKLATDRAGHHDDAGGHRDTPRGQGGASTGAQRTRST